MHKLIEEVRRLAAENRDKTAHCVYIDEATEAPVCIVGHALVNLEMVGTEALLALNLIPVERINSHLSDKIDLRALPWLQFVQDKQDQRYTWSEAVALADEHHEEMA